ncbi:hypothetical protein CEXT_598711 [Caerostris extrusa]|uniref:Uncharacterized protein n=1 Tax=Caerostris extrusa TaxID=172846 RepID=A0AAV4USN6_CAEEX|nr:hypothetical protein CEXT_598711 [Caerostris extrusa]
MYLHCDIQGSTIPLYVPVKFWQDVFNNFNRHTLGLRYYRQFPVLHWRCSFSVRALNLSVVQKHLVQEAKSNSKEVFVKLSLILVREHCGGSREEASQKIDIPRIPVKPYAC